MAPFDFIGCATKAYAYVWEHRRVILKMSGIVLAIKALSFLLVFLMGLQDNQLRMGLFLIPSHFVEGVVVAQILVMAVYDKTLETMEKSRLLAAPPVIGGAIVYVLMKMILSVVIGFAMQDAAMREEAAQAPEPSGGLFFLSLLLIAMMIWLFRMIWVYVPVVLGYRVMDYLDRFKAFRDSFPLIGVWLFCFVPLMVVMLFIASIVQGLVPEGQGAASLGFHMANAVLQAVFDYAVTLLASLGVGFGVYHAMSGEGAQPK